MRVLTTFNFTNYPDLREKYKQLETLRNKYSRIVNGNLQGYDNQAIFDEKEKYANGEFAECVFSIFSCTKSDLHIRRGKEKGQIKKWIEIFGDSISNLTKVQREDLVSLIDVDCIYVLPPQYYDEKLKFQNI